MFYDLSFFSGGIGVLDELAISLPAHAALWEHVVYALGTHTPEEAVQIVGWDEDFLWLLTREEEPSPVRAAAVHFLNTKRHAFQAACHAASRIYFESGSNVNEWVALWGDDTRLNYLGYSQG